jgi:ABC-2 type transport system permease protein
MNKSIFFTLFKNEMAEQFRSRKLVVMLFVFVFFGILSPVTAMFMPEIIGSISESQNIKIIVPEPTWLDAVAQYLKNLSQMGSFILIIVYMGIVAKEKENGILVFLFVKPLSRKAYVLSKFAAATTSALISMGAAFAFSAFYTALFFEGFDFQAYTSLNLLMLLNIVTIMFIVIMFSTLFKSQIVAGVLSFAVYLVISLASQVGNLGHFLPSGLLTEANRVVTEIPINYSSVFASVIICVICIFVSVQSIRKWEA